MKILEAAARSQNFLGNRRQKSSRSKVHAGKRRRHADHLVPKIQDARLIIYTKNPCKTKKNHHHRNDRNLLKKIETWSWSLSWSENSSKFWKTRKRPGSYRKTKKRRGAISKHETNVYICMYICPTPDLADLADLFLRRGSKGMRREREEENAKENERKGWEPARKQGERRDRDERDKTRERRREQWVMMMALFIRCVHVQLLEAHPQEWLCLAFFTPFQFLKIALISLHTCEQYWKLTSHKL